MENLKAYKTSQLIGRILETGDRVLYLVNEDIMNWKIPTSCYTDINSGKGLMLRNEIVMEQSPVPTTLIKIHTDNYSYTDKELLTVKEIKEDNIVGELHQLSLTGEYDIIVQELTKEWVLEFPSGKDLKKVLAKDYYRPMGTRSGRIMSKGKPSPIISDDIDEKDFNQRNTREKRRTASVMVQAEMAGKYGLLQEMYGEGIVQAHQLLTEEKKDVLNLTTSYATTTMLSEWLSLHAYVKGIADIPSSTILSNIRNNGTTPSIGNTRRDLFTNPNYGVLDFELMEDFGEVEETIEAFENQRQSKWLKTVKEVRGIDGDLREAEERSRYDIVLLDGKIIKLNI